MHTEESSIAGELGSESPAPRQSSSRAQRLERQPGSVLACRQTAYGCCQSRRFRRRARLGDSRCAWSEGTAGVAGVAVLLGQASLARHFFRRRTCLLPSSADNQPVEIRWHSSGIALLAYAAGRSG